MRPRYGAMCTCKHLGIHHHYADGFPCLALAGDCPCLAFEEAPTVGGTERTPSRHPLIADMARRLEVEGIIVSDKLPVPDVGTLRVQGPNGTWSPIGILGTEPALENTDEIQHWTNRPLFFDHRFTLSMDFTIDDTNRSAFDALFADISPCTCQYGDHLPAGTCSGTPTNPETHTS